MNRIVSILLSVILLCLTSCVREKHERIESHPQRQLQNQDEVHLNANADSDWQQVEKYRRALRSSTTNPISISVNIYGIDNLMSEKDVVPLEYDAKAIAGLLSRQDMDQLAKLVARLPAVRGFHRIDGIQVAWPPRVVAALVAVRTIRVYCVKNRDGTWSIADVNTAVP